jgi:hypothetical protein
MKREEPRLPAVRSIAWLDLELRPTMLAHTAAMGIRKIAIAYRAAPVANRKNEKTREQKEPAEKERTISGSLPEHVPENENDDRTCGDRRQQDRTPNPKPTKIRKALLMRSCFGRRNRGHGEGGLTRIR